MHWGHLPHLFLETLLPNNLPFVNPEHTNINSNTVSNSERAPRRIWKMNY